MAITETGASPQTSKGRATLTAHDPDMSSTLAAGDFDLFQIAQVTRWGNAVKRDRNHWDIARRSRGLFSGRLHLADADAILKAELQRLKAGVE